MRTRVFLNPSANVLVGNYAASAEHIHIVCDSATASFTVQLPDVALPEHREFVAYNQPASGAGNDVTFVAVTGQTIKNTDTQHVLAPGDSVTFVADLRNNWLITDVNSEKKGRVTSAISPYTVLITDHAIFCDTDGGAITILLPAGASANEIGYTIINCGSSGNNVTITPSGGELLLGLAATDVLYDDEVLDLVFDSVEGWR
jgi:hypothetical protein